MSNMRVYLAGPMTGIPQLNFPAFEYAATVLRQTGYDVISPHELDSPAVKAAATKSADEALVDGKVAGETWGQILARDVRIVADDVQGIAFLPGWENSRGAKLEATVALLCNHKFFIVDGPELSPRSADWVRHQLAANL